MIEKEQAIKAAEKAQKIFENESLREEFLALHTAEEAHDFLAKHGLEMPVEEAGTVHKAALEITDAIQKTIDDNGGEIPDEFMETVAGGASAKKIIDGAVDGGSYGASIGAAALGWTGIGSVAGGAIGAFLGAGIGAAIAAVKK